MNYSKVYLIVSIVLVSFSTGLTIKICYDSFDKMSLTLEKDNFDHSDEKEKESENEEDTKELNLFLHYSQKDNVAAQSARLNYTSFHLEPNKYKEIYLVNQCPPPEYNS